MFPILLAMVLSQTPAETLTLKSQPQPLTSYQVVVDGRVGDYVITANIKETVTDIEMRRKRDEIKKRMHKAYTPTADEYRILSTKPSAPFNFEIFYVPSKFTTHAYQVDRVSIPSGSVSTVNGKKVFVGEIIIHCRVFSEHPERTAIPGKKDDTIANLTLIVQCKPAGNTVTLDSMRLGIHAEGVVTPYKLVPVDRKRGQSPDLLASHFPNVGLGRCVIAVE